MIDRRGLLRQAGLAAPLGILGSVAMAGAATAADSSLAGDLDVAAVRRWVNGYVAAWRARDGDAAARLFTADAIYEAVPGVPDQTFVGRDAIRRYWIDVTASQSDIDILPGAPLVQGRRAAVELWVRLRAPALNSASGNEATIIESNFLQFAAGGLCRRNTEYYIVRTGWIDPPPGWGRS
jgi:SnoaL-like protein